jgi:hypothetical protein
MFNGVSKTYTVSSTNAINFDIPLSQIRWTGRVTFTYVNANIATLNNSRMESLEFTKVVPLAPGVTPGPRAPTVGGVTPDPRVPRTFTALPGGDFTADLVTNGCVQMGGGVLQVNSAANPTCLSIANNSYWNFCDAAGIVGKYVKLNSTDIWYIQFFSSSYQSLHGYLVDNNGNRRFVGPGTITEFKFGTYT